MNKENYQKTQGEMLEELNQKSRIVEVWFHNLNLLLEFLLNEDSPSFDLKKAMKVINMRDSNQYMMITDWINDHSIEEIKKALQDCYDIEREKDFLESSIGKLIL